MWRLIICPSCHRIFVWRVPESALAGAGTPPAWWQTLVLTELRQAPLPASPRVETHYVYRARVWRLSSGWNAKPGGTRTEATLLPCLQPVGRPQINLCVAWNNALLMTTADGANVGGKKGGLSLLRLHAYPSHRDAHPAIFWNTKGSLLGEGLTRS